VNPAYRRLTQREIYRNPWVAVHVHEIVHPTGAPGEHVAIETGRAAGVLVEEQGALLFARQARFAARIDAVEIVKGGAEPGEDPLACAQRELREELGLLAAQWMPLGIVYEIPSIVESPVTLFLARGLQPVASEPEAVEAIGLVRMAIDDAFAAATDGRIDDAVTLAALLRYRLLAP
jgi:ADP-ribose pyrophosphatase